MVVSDISFKKDFKVIITRSHRLVINLDKTAYNNY